MATIEYAFVTSSTAPYMRVLRFIDGVPEIAPDFPQAMGTAAALKAVAWGPDSDVVIAARGAADANPFRGWRKTAGNTFVEFTVAPLPSVSGTIQDIIFMDATHVAALCSVNGLYLGTLNRSTWTVSWSKCTGSPPASHFNLAAHHDTVTLVSTNTTNGIAFYLRTGDTIATTTGSYDGSGSRDMPVFNNNGVMAMVYTAASFPTPVRKMIPTRNLSTSGVTIPSSTSGPDAKAIAWNRTFDRLFWTHNRNQRLFCYAVTVDDGTTWTAVHEATAGPATALPNTLANSMVTLANELLIIACASSTITTGRVRGIQYDRLAKTFTENTAVSALFNDWAATPLKVAASNPVVRGDGVTRFYNDSLSDLLKGLVHLNDLKVLLLNSSAVFDGSQTTLASVIGANEVYGSSWPQGGVDLADGVIARLGVDGVSLTAAIPPTTMTDPGSITFRNLVIYDNAHADKKPLLFVSLLLDQTVAQGQQVTLYPSTGYLIGGLAGVGT